jgi:DNA (cytosine-5)-methyltransferase 1
MLRVISEIKPTYIVGENVYGLTNWNGGVVFEEVCADLENCGYEVQPVLLPASGIGAPHHRMRVWFVAHAYSNAQHQRNGNDEVNASEGREYALNDFNENVGQRVIINTNSERLKGSIPTEFIGQFSNEKSSNEINILPNGRRRKELSFERFPTQSPICRGDDGLPTQLDGITFSKWRKESIKGYGNAIVPQIAYQLFQILETL